ncbi:alpha-E domain-containing protein [soil metagenome]
MLSRIAENMYWIGRYVERAECTARLLNVNYLALAEAPLTPGARGIVTEQWGPLLSITDNEAVFRSHYERADAASVSTWLATDRANSGSVASSLAFARENARTLRDRISTEMWEALNRTYLSLCVEQEGALDEDALYDFCVNARDASYLFFGIADATLPRDQGWYFIRLGQYLERADNTIRTLQVRYRRNGDEETEKTSAPAATAGVTAGVDAHRSMALLKSLSAFEAFRKRYHSQLEPALMAEFLLLDPNFPRSLRFCARVAHEILTELQNRNADSGAAERLAGRLSAQLEYLDAAARITEDEAPSLDDLLKTLAAVSDAVTQTYFRA